MHIFNTIDQHAFSYLGHPHYLLPVLIPDHHLDRGRNKSIARIIDLRAVGDDEQNVSFHGDVDIVSRCGDPVDHSEISRWVDWDIHKEIQIGGDVAFPQPVSGQF